MSAGPRVDRRLRKQLLQLEAESCRLEIASDLARLRQPVEAVRLGSGVVAALGGKASLAASLAGLVGGPRLRWLVRLAPLALAGWRIARLLRERKEQAQAEADAEADEQ